MIGDNKLDRLAQNFSAEVLDRHSYCGDGALAGFVRKLSGHIGEHADLHHTVGYAFGGGNPGCQPHDSRQRNSQRGSANGTHGAPPLHDRDQSSSVVRAADFHPLLPVSYNMHN